MGAIIIAITALFLVAFAYSLFCLDETSYVPTKAQAESADRARAAMVAEEKAWRAESARMHATAQAMANKYGIDLR